MVQFIQQDDLICFVLGTDLEQTFYSLLSITPKFIHLSNNCIYFKSIPEEKNSK